MIPEKRREIASAKIIHRVPNTDVVKESVDRAIDHLRSRTYLSDDDIEDLSQSAWLLHISGDGNCSSEERSTAIIQLINREAQKIRRNRNRLTTFFDLPSPDPSPLDILSAKEEVATVTELWQNAIRELRFTNPVYGRYWVSQLEPQRGQLASTPASRHTKRRAYYTLREQVACICKAQLSAFWKETGALYKNVLDAATLNVRGSRRFRRMHAFAIKSLREAGEQGQAKEQR